MACLLPKLVIHSSLWLVLKTESYEYSFVPIPIFNKVHFLKANNVGGLLQELAVGVGKAQPEIGCLLLCK